MDIASGPHRKKTPAKPKDDFTAPAVLAQLVMEGAPWDFR
jgi:hypothetical protein